MPTENTDKKPMGRFAPSPSGRMHLGNVYTALLSWLSVKSRGGEWILRIEDLDRQRCKEDYARLIEDDLHWLGLDWSRGGLDGSDECGPYVQSRRGELYLDALERLNSRGLLYPCKCRRADILAASAPHQSDGRVVYPGTCRPASPRVMSREEFEGRAVRLIVPEYNMTFCDGVCGEQSVVLPSMCGDFIVRRADGGWAYQLAVVVDDALMGVTEVLRGDDLLLSAAQQIYLYRLLGYEVPRFCHVPLIMNEAGQRLSKRDSSLSMESLRERYAPEEVLGLAAFLAGLTDGPLPMTVADTLEAFSRVGFSRLGINNVIKA